mmetsp:Transcript_24902/g.62774  ORF Transcript_24902/g.62774 Transcript_24902/m.62774 type:complete len:159 (-) Transcript_24902:116-592(-)
MIHLDSITAIVMEVERMTTIDAIVNMTERGGRGTVAEVGMMNAVGDTIAMRGVRIGMKVAGVIEVIDGRGIDMSTEKGTGMEVGREKGRGMEEEVERIEEGGVTGTTTIVVDIVSAPLFEARIILDGLSRYASIHCIWVALDYVRKDRSTGTVVSKRH